MIYRSSHRQAQIHNFPQRARINPHPESCNITDPLQVQRKMSRRIALRTANPFQDSSSAAGSSGHMRHARGHACACTSRPKAQCTALHCPLYSDGGGGGRTMCGKNKIISSHPIEKSDAKRQGSTCATFRANAAQQSIASSGLPLPWPPGPANEK